MGGGSDQEWEVGVRGTGKGHRMKDSSANNNRDSYMMRGESSLGHC